MQKDHKAASYQCLSFSEGSSNENNTANVRNKLEESYHA